MTCRKYQEPTQYLQVSDRAKEPALNSDDYDELYKICPVLNIVQGSFAESYKPGQNQTIDEGMIAFKGRCTILMLPNQLRGNRVWLCCDADIAYLHQFQVYLGQQKKLPSLVLDMMW